MGACDIPAHPAAAGLEPHLWKLQPGDHLCCLFSSDREHRALLSAFIRHGLERRERVVAAVQGVTPEQVASDLAAQGVGVDFYREEGLLSIRDAGLFGQPGPFDAERVIEVIRREMESALRDGCAGVRVSLEVPDPRSSAEYEAALNAFLPGNRCLALCPYDRRRFTPDALLAVMESHPLAAIGADVFENFYYMPPARGVPHTDPALKLSHWVDHLVERRASENQIRTLTRKLMKSQEDERRMISRELHDRVGQDLSSLRIGLETLLDLPLSPADLRAKISRLSALLDRSILAVRDLAYDLRPPGLEIGIAQAVSMLCREFSEKTGVRVEVVSAGIDKLKLDFDFQINLYRMIQEGLNNVHKHARAARAVVKLTAAHPHLLLRIEDDGQGFDMEKRAREIDSEKRMGLRSLKERADLLGGFMVVNSRVGKGTRILVKLPCKEP